MTKRIFSSICLVTLTVFLASLILIIGVLYNDFSHMSQAQLHMQTRLAAQGAARQGMDYFQDLDISGYRITWIASDGTVLYDNELNTAEMENHLEREEVLQARSTGYGESQRYSASLTRRYFYSALRLPDHTILRLSLAQNSVLALLLDMKRPILLIILLAVLLSILLAVSLTRRILQPINAIDLDHPWSNPGYKEIAPLLARIDSQQQRLRQQEASLERAAQLRREFTANVSHELKTPLHSISGYAELLKQGLVKAEDILPFSEKIYSEAQRMIRLVEDILNLSRLDEKEKAWKSGKASYEDGDGKWQPLDLLEVAQNVIHSLEPEAAASQVSLKLSGESAVISGLEPTIRSILYNLCDNAIKYNHSHGSVTVTIENTAKGAILSVQDTGIGIAPQDQERIFERFYRVDKSRSKQAGGTGLGLSIVKHGVNLHRGTIRLDSALGEGTRITVYFPSSST